MNGHLRGSSRDFAVVTWGWPGPVRRALPELLGAPGMNARFDARCGLGQVSVSERQFSFFICLWEYRP